MVTQSHLRFGKTLEKLKLNDIKGLITNRIDESHNLEYKKPTNSIQDDCNRMAQAISSFLNTDGGILVYGVSEKKEGDQNFPNELLGTKVNKEQLENLLVSRIQPWDNGIKIRRIPKKKKSQEAIYIVEVPRSSNPPHMYNHVYYQRMNFKNEPMGHETVLRAFQTSWIRRKDLFNDVIEPLYSEIKLICEELRLFEVGNGFKSIRYNAVIERNRYLYDKLNPQHTDRIDKFYLRINQLQPIIDWQTFKIARKIIQGELCKLMPDRRDWIVRHSEKNLIELKVSVLEYSGDFSERDPVIPNNALFRKVPLEEYLNKMFPDGIAVDFESFHFVGGKTPMDKTTFGKLWRKCELRAQKNKVYISSWKERLELIRLGEEILKEILT